MQSQVRQAVVKYVIANDKMAVESIGVVSRGSASTFVGIDRGGGEKKADPRGL